MSLLCLTHLRMSGTGIILRGEGFKGAGPQSQTTYIHLHSNEETALEAGKRFVEENSGSIYSIDLMTGKNRNIGFKKGLTYYTFDPNRIFSDEGIRKTLDVENCPEICFQKVQGLRKEILKRTYLDNSKLVVGLHNNTEEKEGVDSYITGEYREDAIEYHKNPELNRLNFFLTTEKEFFDYFRDRNYNAVLENPNLLDEGYLSSYCANKKIPYINVEAGYECLEDQLDMLKVASEINSQVEVS